MSVAVEIALSVRQPWAWAIVHGPKDVENRSAIAVSNGAMTPRRIAIHASVGMTRDEYEHAAAFMARLGVECPRPDLLVRGGIIGAATVTSIVKQHESPWFFGPRGLVLDDKEACDPVPCSGSLGYFHWKPSSGELPSPALWMKAWPHRRIRSASVRVCGEATLFDDLQPNGISGGALAGEGSSTT